MLHRESEGNPFFIREMLRELVDKGAIYQRGKRWVSDVTSVDELGIAEGVREVVSARLARLSDGCNQVLLTASIIGRHFDAAVLRRIGGFDDSQTRGMLEEAERAGVLARVGADGLYVFSHNLIRQTLYGRLANTRRVRLHRRTAEVLERLYGEDPEHLSALAYHYRQAALDGDSSKAIDYAIRAGAHATEHLAHDQAVEPLRYALDELRRSGRGDERATVELLCDLGDAEWNAGEFERSRGAFAEAAEVARRTGAVDALARAALGFGGGLAFRAGEGDEELIALLEQALQSVGSEGPMRARVMSRLAEALTFTGPRERVEELGRAALDAARTAGEPAALAAVLSNAHWALWAPDNLEERLYMAREIVRAAEKAGDAALAMDGHLWSVSDLLELGDVASADREAQVWLDLASDLRRPYHLWLVAVYKAMRALMEGALEQGERLAQEAFELGQRGGNQNAFQLFGVQVAALRREQNRYLELEDGLKLFVEQYPAIPTWRCALALMYSEAGRTEQAREQFEVLTVNRFGDLPRDMFWMTAMVQLSQCCAFLQDAERASQLRALLMPHKGRNVTLAVVASSWGSSDRSLGLLAATLQRWDEAATHFERALAMNERMGARTWLAQTQQEFAAMLGTRRARADAKRSEELLAAALATARELGLQRLEQKIASTREQRQRPGPVALA